MAIVNLSEQRLKKRWQDMMAAEMERTGSTQAAVIERIINIMDGSDANIEKNALDRLNRAEKLNQEMLALLQGVVADAAAAQRDAVAAQRNAEATQRAMMSGREDVNARSKELERRIGELTGELEQERKRNQELEAAAIDARTQRAEALAAKAEAETAAAQAKGDASVQREWAAGLSRQVEALQSQVDFLRTLVGVDASTGNAGGGSSD